jgi:exoribonuclease R
MKFYFNNSSELKKCIGMEGDVEAETEAILIENGVDYSEFSQDVIFIQYFL